MKKLFWFLPQISLVLAVATQAQDLPAATDARAKSLAGTVFEQAKGEVAAKRDQRTAQQIADFSKHFISKGLLKTRLKNRNFGWKTEAHPNLPRVRLRRQETADQTPRTADEAFADLVASQGKVDEATVSSRAEELVQALHGEGAFPAEETFVPVAQGKEVVIFRDPASGAQQSYVHKFRRVYRRYVGGVPVAGRAGEFEVELDADGEVEQVEIPTDSYTLTGASLPKLAGGTGLDRVSKRAGFDSRVTKLHAYLKRSGKQADVDDMLCGYVDDQTKTKLDRGCLVRYHAGDLREELLSAE